MLQATLHGERYELYSPTLMPKAGSFLWNQRMMIQATCRGYMTAQFMQPEPAKYSHAPNLEAKTFMQPEQNYYTHHPGRFVYVKDDETGEIFSAPYEPVRAKLDRFTFSVGKSDIRWIVEHLGIRVEMVLSLPKDDVVEMWTIEVLNMSGRQRKISIFPYFTIGYMSWMNQGAEYSEDLGGIVASSITPYQGVGDYFKNKFFKDKTYLLCEEQPDSWEVNHDAFEGDGGLHSPSGLKGSKLLCGDAKYETPVAVVHYQLTIKPKEDRKYRFVFGPAFDNKEIRTIRDKYLSQASFEENTKEYASYIEEGRGCLKIESPDEDLDNFVNNWLPRQLYYHGDVNRLTTDPQTRNYFQDNMGMSYIKPEVARKAFITALAQQEPSGAMPDGILLSKDGELKYINQIPHTDHCVWLPVAMEIYLAETADYGLLQEEIRSANGDVYSVFDRFCRAMDWLLSENARDERGLSYIAQGDWCDPMNMAGYKGKGVSGWLTVATAYALQLWGDICEQQGHSKLAERYRACTDEVNNVANKYFWDGDWFARGITDDNITFGIKKDVEGRIWLNPQAWAILGGAASEEQRAKILKEVDAQLMTPYGALMFAPAFTGMREDIGRVTQKFPGQGENGSVYNHASAFYIHALYDIGEADRAYKLLRCMIPGPTEEDYLQRGQLPVFIPNYYRGCWKESPRTAGRSSQLFNTGTVSWVYRSFIEGLCGLHGDAKGLRIQPQLPSDWNGVKVTRVFREATFLLDIQRSDVKKVTVIHAGKHLPEARVVDIRPGAAYELSVLVPK